MMEKRRGPTEDEMMDWMRHDPAAALQWIAREFPAGDRRRYFGGFLAGLAETDPAYAASIVRELLPPGSERQSALEAIAASWMKHDAPAAASWALGLGGAERAAPLALLLYSWRDEEPAAVQAWVRSIAVADDRDWVLSRLVGWQIEKNPADAGSLLRDISDPAVREQAAAGLIRDWARDDFEAALVWTLRLDPPPLRSHVLSHLGTIADETPDVWR